MTTMASFFNKLLLATEHTDFDIGAEVVAMDLARQFSLPLAAVLAQASYPELETLVAALASQREQDGATKTAQLREQARALGVELDIRVRSGSDPYREIVDEATTRASELIVIRRRGTRSFLANLLLGEMVAKVVAHASCNALIVPRDAVMWKHRVLVAAEPTMRGEQIVTQAAAVAAACALPLSIVSVIPYEDIERRRQSESFLDRTISGLRSTGVPMQSRTLIGLTYLEILDAVQREGADLLVMGSRCDQSIKRALIGGVAQKAIGLARCPVLAVHLPAQVH